MIFTEQDFIFLCAGELEAIQVYISGYMRKDQPDIHPGTAVGGHRIVQEIKRKLESMLSAADEIGKDILPERSEETADANNQAE